MAKWALINPVEILVSTGVMRIRPGEVVDDSLPLYSAILAAGGELWSGIDTYVAAALSRASRAKLRGANDSDLESIMRSATAQSLRAGGGGGGTKTTGSFIVPAVGATALVAVEASSGMVVGQSVYIEGAGSYSVASKPDSLSVVLRNLGFAGNAAPSTVVGSGAQVGPAGESGASISAEMGLADNIVAMTLTNQNQWYLVNPGTWVANIAALHATMQLASGTITASVAARCFTNATISYEATTAFDQVEFGIFKNGVYIASHDANSWIFTGFTITSTIVGIDDLLPGDVVDLRVRCTTSAGLVLTVTEGNFNVISVSGGGGGPPGLKGDQGLKGDTGAPGLGGATAGQLAISDTVDTSLMSGGSGTFGYLDPVTGKLTPTDALTIAKSGAPLAFTGGSIVGGGFIADAKFTTDGGAPTYYGQPVYFATSTADSGAGAGKLSCKVPSEATMLDANTTTANWAFAGFVVSYAGYVGSKTCKVWFAPTIRGAKLPGGTYFINATTGSDANDGSSGAPWKTYRGGFLAAAGWTPDTFLVGDTVPYQINLGGDPASADLTDPIFFPFEIFGVIDIRGAHHVDATVTGNWTTRVRTPMGSTRSGKLTALAVAASFFTSGGPGGASLVDAVAYDTTASPAIMATVDYDMNVDGTTPIASTARMSEAIEVLDPSAVSQTITHAVPANGSTWQIGHYTRWAFSTCNPRLGYTAGQAQLRIYRVEGTPIGSSIELNFNTSTLLVTFSECTIICDTVLENSLGVIFNACTFKRNVTAGAGTTSCYFYACRFNIIAQTDEPWQAPRMKGYGVAYDDCMISMRVGGNTTALRIHIGGGLKVGTAICFYTQAIPIQIDSNGHLGLVSSGSYYGGEGDMRSNTGAVLAPGAVLQYPVNQLAANTFALNTTGPAWSFASVASLSNIAGRAWDFFAPGTDRLVPVSAVAAWALLDLGVAGGGYEGCVESDTTAVIAKAQALGGT